MVERQVRGLQAAGTLCIGYGIRQALARQCIHHVQVDGIEGLQRKFRCSDGLVFVVDAAKGFEVAAIETLDAERYAIHAGVSVTEEMSGIDCAGIRLQGDLCAVFQRGEHADMAEDTVYRFRREQARRPAAEKHAAYLAAPDSGRSLLQVGD